MGLRIIIPNHYFLVKIKMSTACVSGRPVCKPKGDGCYATALGVSCLADYSPPTVISPISSVGDAVVPSLKLRSLPTALTLLNTFNTFPATVIS